VKTITKTKLAASPEAGYSRTNTTTPLAFAWVAYCEHPEDLETKEKLAWELDQALIDVLPNRRCNGILAGSENEVRQAAILLLLDRYLAGNVGLIAATKELDLQQIENQIQRSIIAAIRTSTRTLLHSIEKDIQKHAYCESIDEHPAATCVHPAERKTLWELPYELQRELMFVALRIALKEKLLPQHNVRMVMTMMDESLSQSAMAESMGISRSAVHQRLAPVREYLRNSIETQEFPLK